MTPNTDTNTTPTTSFTDSQKSKLRIRVAKDVLHSLPTLKAVRGAGWFSGEVARTRLSRTKSSNAVAKILQKECHVCGLGACFLSLVKIDNKFDFSELDDDNPDSKTVQFKPIWHDIRDRLLEVFSYSQLRMIESIFEEGGGQFGRISHLPKWWYDISPIPRTRLRLIMENIVRNKGTFEPNDIPTSLG